MKLAAAFRRRTLRNASGKKHVPKWQLGTLMATHASFEFAENLVVPLRMFQLPRCGSRTVAAGGGTPVEGTSRKCHPELHVALFMGHLDVQPTLKQGTV